MWIKSPVGWGRYSAARRRNGVEARRLSAADTSLDLLQKCVSAVREGSDFPSIWHDILKGHPLVIGVPVQADLDRLEIPLLNHQRLIFNSLSKEFRIA